jgi:hypothetical protein
MPKPEIGRTTPAMSEIMLPLSGLSPVNGKALSARFDGGALTSDAGLRVQPNKVPNPPQDFGEAADL